MSYFSIDDILASEPRVHTTLHVRGHNLGHLDLHGAAAHWSTHTPDASALPPGHDGTRDLPAGHRVALPFWLAETMAARGTAAIELPRCFGTRARHALRADARAVRLHARCRAFYALGVRLAALVRDVALGTALVRAFAARCWGVVDTAAFAAERGVEALDGLDETERGLFFASHGLDIALRRWKERRADRIVCEVDAVLGKRKRDDAGSPVTPAAKARR